MSRSASHGSRGVGRGSGPCGVVSQAAACSTERAWGRCQEGQSGLCSFERREDRMLCKPGACRPVIQTLLHSKLNEAFENTDTKAQSNPKYFLHSKYFLMFQAFIYLPYFFSY